jgi:hypothetical protein
MYWLLERAAAVLSVRAGLLLLLVLLHASGNMRLRVCASSSSFDIREHLSTKVGFQSRPSSIHSAAVRFWVYMRACQLMLLNCSAFQECTTNDAKSLKA